MSKYLWVNFNEGGRWLTFCIFKPVGFRIWIGIPGLCAWSVCWYKTSFPKFRFERLITEREAAKRREEWLRTTHV